MIFFFSLIHAAANLLSHGAFVFPVGENAIFLAVSLPEKTKRFEITCDTKNPKTIEVWRKKTGAKMVFNGGYFDEHSLPVGFVKTKKNEWGKPQDHPAVFSLFSDGSADIKLSEEVDAKNISAATSSFPLLVWNGENKFPKETGKFARRTILGEKNESFWLFISLSGRVSLAESARFLQDFGVNKALNLDGGPSTGFSSDFKEVYSVPVPCAISVFEK